MTSTRPARRQRARTFRRALRLARGLTTSGLAAVIAACGVVSAAPPTGRPEVQAAYPGQIIGYRANGAPIRLLFGGSGPALVQSKSAIFGQPLLVQSKSGTTSGAVGVALTITLTSATTAGNCLIAKVAIDGGAGNGHVASITLGGAAGNFHGDVIANGNDDVEIWSDWNCAGGQTSVVITSAGGSSTQQVSAWVEEWSGLVNTASPFDKGSSAIPGTSSTSWSSGTTATLSQALELAVGMAIMAPTVTGPASPWTNLAQVVDGGGEHLIVGYRVVGATTGLAYAGTVSPTTIQTSAIATYKAAFTGTGTVTLSSPTTAGNCLIVKSTGASSGNAAAVTGVTLGGSAGNFAQSVTGGTVADIITSIWADPNCAGSQTAVAATFSYTGVPAVCIEVEEWSGLVTSSVVDQTVSASGTSTSWSSTATSPTTQPVELAIGAVGVGTTGTITGPSSPWVNQTQVTNTVGGLGLLTGYDILAATGAVTYAGTVGASSVYTAVVATFLAASTALTITTASLPGGTTGVAYSQTVSATGGTTPYTWSISAGTLPAGLSINSSSGVISGTPQTAGTSSFTVKVTDAVSTQATKPLSIVITSNLTITTSTLPDGLKGAAYSQALAATGGFGSYTWSLISGTLPTGLSMSSAGVISGTPTHVGTSSFTVQVADAGGNTTPASLSLTIDGPFILQTSDYLQLGQVTAATIPAWKSSPRNSGGPWTAAPSGSAIAIAIYDQTASGPPLQPIHMTEDAGAKVTTLVYGTGTGQLLGVLESTAVSTGPLNANPYFTSGVTPWTATGGTITQSNAETQGGFPFSGLLTPSGSASQSYAVSEAFAVTPLEDYTVQGVFYSPVGHAMSLTVNWLDWQGTALSTSSVSVTLAANTWTPLVDTYTAPDGAAKASIQVTETGTPPVTALVYLSAVLMQPAWPDHVTSIAPVVQRS